MTPYFEKTTCLMCFFFLREKNSWFLSGDFWSFLLPPLSSVDLVPSLIHGNVAEGQREGVAGEHPNTQGSLGFSLQRLTGRCTTKKKTRKWRCRVGWNKRSGWEKVSLTITYIVYNQQLSYSNTYSKIWRVSVKIGWLLPQPPKSPEIPHCHEVTQHPLQKHKSLDFTPPGACAESVVGCLYIILYIYIYTYHIHIYIFTYL